MNERREEPDAGRGLGREVREGLDTLRQAAALATGNSLALVLQMLAGVLTAHFLLPAELGLFNGIGLAVGYASLLQLGIVNGLNRELPFLWGSGDHDLARRLARAALTYTLGLGVFVFLVFSGIALWQWAHGHGPAAMGWLAFALIGLASVLGDQYYPVLYRTTGRFSTLARITALRSAANLLLVVLVAVFGYVGLCVKGVATAAGNLLLLVRGEPVRVRPGWWMDGVRRLVRVGLPIFAVGQLWTLWILGNNTLVLKLMGPRGFGLYSIVLVVGNLATALPNGISQVVYPRMARQWGGGAGEADLVASAQLPAVLSLAATVCIAGTGWLLLPPAVHWLLPRYVEAIGAARWALLTGFTLALMPVNNIYNVIGRQELYALVLGLGIAANGTCLAAFAYLTPPLGLESFVQALLAGQATVVVSSYLLLYRLFPRRRGTQTEDR